MERDTYVHGLEECCYDDHTTQVSLQIQCNPYQNTNGIFHRIKTNNSRISMETQKTLKSPNNLEKEQHRGVLNVPDFRHITKLQSSKQKSIGIKTNV